MRRTMPRTPRAVQYFGHPGDTAAHRSTMSFILDALKKSENSRLRQDHPAIFDAQAATVRRQGLPRWGIALMVLLGLNLLILAYALWRPADLAPVAATTADTMTSAATTAAAPLTAAPTLATPTRATPTSAASPRPISAPASVTPRPAEATTVAVTPRNARAAAQAEDSPTLPSRDDLLAAGAAIPEANLNMHVYDATPALRFVLLNGQRLREGDVSREGLRVEQILPDGVLLSAGGNSFMLSIN